MGIPIEKTIKAVSDFWKNKIYNKLTKQDFELAETDFDVITKTLKEYGHTKLAKKYEEIVENSIVDGIIKFEKESGKVAEEGKEAVKKYIQVDTKLKPIVDMVVEPFKFVWGAIKLPFKLTKTLVNIPASSVKVKEEKLKNAKKIIESVTALPEEKLEAEALKAKTKITDGERKLAEALESFFGPSKDKPDPTSQEIFATSAGKVLDKINEMKSHKLSETQFKEFLNKSILNSFNSTSQSKYSNADLGTITKIASSTVTSTFLVADNYNMVMLKSDGENKEEAAQRAKERVVQRVSSLFYQTMFMKWFNQTFANQYHSSLSGMSSVVAANTVATEVFTRKSIGMPLGAKSYEELVDIDNKNMSRNGFVGGYFKFMSMLTGKKPLAKKAPVEQPQAKVQATAFEMLKNDAKNNATTDLLAIYGSKK